MSERSTDYRDGRRYRGRHRRPTQPVARTAMRTGVAGATVGACIATLPVAGSVAGAAPATQTTPPNAKAALAAHNPRGSIAASLHGHRLHVMGTVTDPDSKSPVMVQVAVNGHREAYLSAKGSNNSFDISTLLPYGTKVVQVNGMNIGTGSGNAMIGSTKKLTSLNPADRNPRGSAHITRSGNSITVSGVAADPDNYRGRTIVRAYDHGKWIAGGYTSPTSHRFVLHGTVPNGSAASVVVYAYNQGLGTTNPRLAAYSARTVRAAVSSSYAGNQRIAASMLARYGWGQDQMASLIKLWSKESGWRTNAANPSGAYGIPQALPGSKMASAGSDWQTNPATQIAWGLNYIKGRYGSPNAAWAHSVSYNWY